MSENERNQRQALLDPIWNEMKSLWQKGAALRPCDTIFADNFVGFIGEAALGNIDYAKTNNIIDGTKSFPEFRQYMIDEFGLDEEVEIDTTNLFSIRIMKTNKYKDIYSDNQISVITAEGAIMKKF